MSAKLEKAVHEWLTRVATSETPAKDVIADNIGLFEIEGGYSAYLAGSTKYDADNPDWAHEEAFTPKEKYLVVLQSSKEGTRDTRIEQIVFGGFSSCHRWL